MNIDLATAFTDKNVLEATRTLLAQLNVAVHTKTTSPVRPSELAPVHNKVVDAALSKVSELYYVGYVGEESFGGNFEKLPDDYRGMMVFAVEAKGGAGDYVVEWAGTLVVGVRDAIPKSASVFLPGAYDRPTRTRLHGKIQLDADARCAALVIDGKNAQSGTWGSSQSAAEHKDDAVFSGAGVLTVGSAGTVLLVR